MQDDWVESERKRLVSTRIDASRHYRILAIGRKVNGGTDIVACLERALRNVGHHVVFLDLAHHPRIIHGPQLEQGGHGPNYLNIAQLHGAIERFRPQVLVCLGSGIAIRDNDAAWLASRRVTTLGMTLSDPDVFTSVRSFAGTFDFHTTNSLTALEMYREDGLRNTLHFPFGIDRAFVTQQVTVPSEYKADIICLGHASSHPIRDVVMKSVLQRLGDRLRIRTYGRGWSLPGSHPVEDLELLQAARGGLVHVNFPMTRAGYTNVKCGVFETIAGGSILVTSEFDEMRRLFHYGREIIGYSKVEDLPDVLESLFTDRARMDEIRRAAFSRLVSDHLYEHRWNKLFDDILALARAETEWLGSARARRIRECLEQDNGRARLIALSGFYGARNLGDDLILEAIAGKIENEVHGAQTIVIAQNPQVVDLETGRQAVSRRNHRAVDAMAAKCDAFVLGGGGLWHDYTFQKAGGICGIAMGATTSIAGGGIGGMFAHIRGIPFHIVGLGVGPVHDPDAKSLMKFVAGLADTIMVRDDESRAALQAAGVASERIDVEPDVVYSLKLHGAAPESWKQLTQNHFVLGVNLRPWDRGSIPISHLISELSAAIRVLANDVKAPLALALLPMQEGANFDRAVLADLKRQLEAEFKVLELPAPIRGGDFVGALECVDLFISMRLHGCLLAHRLCKPAVGIAYDPKLTVHFSELGRSDLAIPIESRAADISAAMRKAIAMSDGQHLREITSELSTRSEEALRRVARSIGAAPQRPVIWGIEDNSAERRTRSQRSTVADQKDIQRPASRKSWVESIAQIAHAIVTRTAVPIFRAGGRILARVTQAVDWGRSREASQPRSPIHPGASDSPLASALNNNKAIMGGWTRARVRQIVAGGDAESARDDPESAALNSADRAHRVDWMLSAASQRVAAGDFAGSIDILNHVRRLDPVEPRAFRALVEIYRRQRNWKKLADHIAQARAVPGLKDAATTAEFDMYLARGRINDARRMINALTDDIELQGQLRARLSEMTRSKHAAAL